MAEPARNHEYDDESEQFDDLGRMQGGVSSSAAGESQPRLTADVMQRLGISANEVWLYYLSMGGVLDEMEIAAYLHGLLELTALDRDMVSQSVNELFDDIVRAPRAPYSWQCSRPASAADDQQ